MRQTVIALFAAAALVAGCQQPADAPAETASPAAASTTPAPEMPADAPPQEEVSPDAVTPAPVPVPATGETVACSQSIGAEAAARLAQRCTAVSPATRPPCNVANPCEMIQGEIDRSCALWKRDGNPPAECAA